MAHLGAFIIRLLLEGWADDTSQSAMRRRRPHKVSQVQGGHCFYGCRRRPPLKGSLGGPNWVSGKMIRKARQVVPPAGGWLKLRNPPEPDIYNLEKHQVKFQDTLDKQIPYTVLYN